MSILVIYASKHGATAGIAKRIAETLRHEGHASVVQSVAEVERLESYDAVVLGSAVYYGGWMKEPMEFVHHHRTALDRRPIWLFSSGPLGEAVQDEEQQPHELVELRQALQPRDHRIFFGALDFSKLSFAERMLVKGIRAPQGDFRDWHAIDVWATSIAQALSHVVVDAASR